MQRCISCWKYFRYDAEQLQSEANAQLLSKVNIFYVEGFFLSHSPNVVMELRNVYADKVLVLNLCGEYVCRNSEYCKNVVKLLQNLKFVFGNKDELKVFLETSSHIVEDNTPEKLTIESLSNSMQNVEDDNVPDMADIISLDNEEDQYFIATDAQYPILCFILRLDLQR